MKLRVLGASLFVLAILGFPTASQATPITYVISATTSGTIGATPFTDALVTLTGTADTADVVSGLFGFATGVPLTTTTVTIAGLGTATLLDPTQILSSVIPFSLEGEPPLPAVVIGRSDEPTTLGEITGIGFVESSALLGYSLTTSIGPIVGSPGGISFISGCGTPGHDPCLATTLGSLSFAPDNDSLTGVGTFSATLQPVGAPVPEPGTLLLLGSGLAAVGRRAFRSRRPEIPKSD